jgi:hypothetical protein
MTREISTVDLLPYQWQAINHPFTHFAFFAGIASGKTFTGSHYVIDHIIKYPDLTGFIGANDYNQLSTATLRELFYWLGEYGFEYVIDRQPPREWGMGRRFKNYANILHVRNPLNKKVTTIFTRVMSEPDSFRGIQISWYWIDEFRDTEQYAHDVLLSRMRESKYIKGLATSTPNGEDWSYERFTKKADGKLYNSMHVRTEEAVFADIISRDFYNGLLQTYSPMMALQELEAKHVNVFGGRAYYAADHENRMDVSPWGDTAPNPERPLIIGMDFNYSPAPCIWMIGQEGPGEYSEHVHWFREIVDTQTSSSSMTLQLITQFPNFFYRIFGDYSGNQGTTSNAGETDYIQISNVLSERGCQFSIDTDQCNPHVKDRIENMNAQFKNGLGEIHQTYSPQGCPNFDTDIRMVGWKETTMRGRGKLDNGGDINRTHASDGAGYAIWKIRPPGRRGQLIESIPSPHLIRLDHVVGAVLD